MTAPESDREVTYSGLLTGTHAGMLDVHDLSAAGNDCVMIRLAEAPGHVAFSLEGTLGDLLALNLRLTVRLGDVLVARQRARGRQRRERYIGATDGITYGPFPPRVDEPQDPGL